jgi:purine-binding chemotaxis protein CheW
MSGWRVDWSSVHHRLEAINARISKGFSPAPEERERIFRTRASLLARQSAEERNGDTIEVVEFMLASERYGIESIYVREVSPLRGFTPVPCTPRFVLGLVNVRGRIISVIDLKKFFELPEKGISDLNKVIILQDHQMEFGILADSILAVRTIDVKEIQPSLPTLKGMREEFLKGITEERLVVLDAEKLLSNKNIVVYEEA